jgi:fimbrial chaperone protein
MFAALALSSPALAGALEIGPTTVQMIGPERAGTITVKNVGDAATNIQVRTVDWTQVNGDDVYTPSTTLAASPPLIKLGPGESQVVRLIVRGTPAAPTEKAYRLILDEVASEKTINGAGVHTTIRALVPVFITPSLAARPNLRWSATRSNGAVVLAASNEGATRERLINLKVTAGGVAAPDTLEGYVLSHQTRSWALPSIAPTATSLSTAAEGGYGTVQANVPVSP